MKKIILILCLLLSNITYSQVYDVDSDDYCGDYCGDYYADLITKDLITKYFEDKGVQIYYEKDKSLICTHYFYNQVVMTFESDNYPEDVNSYVLDVIFTDENAELISSYFIKDLEKLDQNFRSPKEMFLSPKKSFIDLKYTMIKFKKCFLSKNKFKVKYYVELSVTHE